MRTPDTPGRPMFEDEPLLDRVSDDLSRGEYADRVAEVILQILRRPASTVIAVVGPWGSGKTTLLNFVTKELDGTQVKVVKFNPWMVSDLSSLVADFFAALLSALPKNKKKARKAVALLARAVSPLASVIDIPGVDLGKGFVSMADRLDDGGSRGLQRRVIKQLKRLNKKILVILDDLDRLHAEELLMVFKLVRLVGRLPNVHYLLAYDESTVLGVIKDTKLAGNDMDRARYYLEKMVQVRLVVPPMNESARKRFLDGLLSDILTRYGVEFEYEAQQRLASVYHDHLRLALREPRQIKRFCGQVEAHYPLVQGEVDFMDFLLITYLRVFHPIVADLLPVYMAELTGTDPTRLVEVPGAVEPGKLWRERLLRAEVKQHELDRMLDLLANMFPTIAEAIGRPGFPGYGGKIERGVWSPDYFNRYFQLGFGSDDLPDSVVREALHERLATDLGPAWSSVVNFLATDAGLVLRKVDRIIRDEGHNKEWILSVLCDLARHVPPASDLLDNSEAIIQTMISELLTEVRPLSIGDLLEDLVRRSSVVFVATATVWGKQRLEEEHRLPSPWFVDICTAVSVLVVEELDRQAALAPQETHDVMNLLLAWSTLDSSADTATWLLTRFQEEGPWSPVGFAALLVPVARTFGSGRRWLGDFNFGLLEQLIGEVDFTALIGDPATDPVYQVDDPPPEDISFGARRSRALRALARRSASED